MPRLLISEARSGVALERRDIERAIVLGRNSGICPRRASTRSVTSGFGPFPAQTAFRVGELTLFSRNPQVAFAGFCRSPRSLLVSSSSCSICRRPLEFGDPDLEDLRLYTIAGFLDERANLAGNRLLVALLFIDLSALPAELCVQGTLGF